MPGIPYESVPGTAGTAPEAQADLAALAAAVRPAGAPARLLGGDPVLLGPRLPAAEPVAVRAACATETAPAAWAGALELAPAVWAPHAFARDALVRSGVRAERVRVVAPVLDAERFSPDGPAERPAGARSFVFLAIVDWTLASGWDVLVRAWAEEFGADEDVTLVLRAWSGQGFTPTQVGELLLSELDAHGIDPGAMADLILETSAAQAHPSPAAYRGADCFVAPARADAWGRRVLEAMATGLPVIATDWAAGAALIEPGAGHLLPATPADVTERAAREQTELLGGRWAEPDVDALRRLLRAAVRDPEAGRATGNRARALVVQRHASAAGVTAPAGGAEPVRVRRAAAPGARPEDVSFVLQGPIERRGEGSTARACAAIRAHFPGAEIVVSTWEGAEAAGLDCDAVVHSPDPGATGSSPFNANTNRLLASSLAGVRAAGRPLVVKMRSDLVFRSSTLLTHWGRWEERADELRLFEHRVLVPHVFTRRASYLSPYPMHASDWCAFGTREDLERLLDVPRLEPAATTVDVTLPRPARLYHWLPKVPAYTPEQWIWTQAMRKAHPQARLAHVFDVTPRTLDLTERSFANNLAILDAYTQFGLWNPKYTGAGRLFEDVTLCGHEQWLELYDIHCRGDVLDRADVESLLRRLARGELDGLTRGDASRLRRAGLGWEAQLLDCVAIGSRVRRDPTTGGMHRWHLDAAVVEQARAELVAAAAAQPSARRNRPASAATPV